MPWSCGYMQQYIITHDSVISYRAKATKRRNTENHTVRKMSLKLFVYNFADIFNHNQRRCIWFCSCSFPLRPRRDVILLLTWCLKRNPTSTFTNQELWTTSQQQGTLKNIVGALLVSLLNVWLAVISHLSLNPDLQKMPNYGNVEYDASCLKLKTFESFHGRAKNPSWGCGSISSVDIAVKCSLVKVRFGLRR